MKGNTSCRPVEQTALHVLMAILIVSAVLLHMKLMVRLDFDGENSRAESETLYALRAARNGQTLYRDFAEPPHIVTQYTPMFYLVPATLARGLGVDSARTFVVGRVYTYVFWLGVAGLLYALVRQEDGTRLGGGLAAALWLASGLAPHWANSYRPDSAAVFFSLAAIWLYRRQQFSAVVVSLIVAALHKQSAIMAIAVIVVQDCRQRRYCRAGLITAAWVGALGVMQVFYGDAFAKNVFGSLSRTDLAAAPLYTALALVRGAPAFAGAALSRPKGLWRNYLWAALVFAVITTMKAGANVNYFLEPFAVACVLTGLWMSATGGWLRLGWLGLALASALLGLAQGLSGVTEWTDEWTDHRAVRARESKVWEEVLGRLQPLPEPLLVEDPYLALRLGRTPFILNLADFRVMHGGGGFDEEEFVKRLEAGGFAAIIASRPIEETEVDRPFSTRWREIIDRRYALEGGAQGLYIYRARQSSY